MRKFFNVMTAYALQVSVYRCFEGFILKKKGKLLALGTLLGHPLFTVTAHAVIVGNGCTICPSAKEQENEKKQAAYRHSFQQGTPSANDI
jgi:hypothetical protein